MAFSYRVRDKTVTVDQLGGLLAVRFADDETARRVRKGGVACAWRGRPLVPFRGKAVGGARRAVLEAAGWVLMRPLEGEPADPRQQACEPVAVGRVYSDESGELMINTGRLTVRLRKELSDEEARAALARHDLSITRRLGFSPNLFEVEATGSRAALEVAHEATEDDDYEYAEPQMIRKLGHR